MNYDDVVEAAEELHQCLLRNKHFKAGLRIDVLKKLPVQYSNTNLDLLAQLFGHADYSTMVWNFSEKDQRLLDLLLGENGYTIYKMLCARRGL